MQRTHGLAIPDGQRSASTDQAAVDAWDAARFDRSVVLLLAAKEDAVLRSGGIQHLDPAESRG